MVYELSEKIKKDIIDQLKDIPKTVNLRQDAVLRIRPGIMMQEENRNTYIIDSGRGLDTSFFMFYGPMRTEFDVQPEVYIKSVGNIVYVDLIPTVDSARCRFNGNWRSFFIEELQYMYEIPNEIVSTIPREVHEFIEKYTPGMNRTTAGSLEEREFFLCGLQELLLKLK